MTKKFDRDGVGDICCQSFLVHFTKVGAEERGREHVQGLQKQRKEGEERKKKMEEKLEAAAKRNHLDESLINNFTQADYDSAVTKFREAARHYTINICNMPGSLDAFSVASMLPGVFQEKCQRSLHVTLTNAELGAIVGKYPFRSEASVAGADTPNAATSDVGVQIDCPAFQRLMKRLGFEEKEKLWKAEMRMRERAESEKEKRMAQVKESFERSMEAGAMAPESECTPEHLAEGLQKLRYAASHIDSDSVSLSAFQGTHISPGQLREKLKSAIGIRLSPFELGAVVRTHLKMTNGQIACADIVTLILQLGRERREELRLKRIAAERAEREKMIAEKQQLLQQKHRLEADILQHDHTHEASLLDSLNNAAQAFALDK